MERSPMDVLVAFGRALYFIGGVRSHRGQIDLRDSQVVRRE